ncbi:MAG TPA: pitrilysin family protein [Acidobacteriota bacterium]|nr:pitrilysin family protein [Acidobacteriota bacterium]
MRCCRIATVALLATVVIFAPFIHADDLPDLKFEKYELPNGLDVILHEDHTIPVVAVNVWYHVGSKNEMPGRTGFAHLFEHMMFQGSEHFNTNFTDGIIRYGGTRNGSTDEDRTNYWENMPANYLEKTLWLEADRMGYLLPAITQERLDNQRSVVMNEKRQNVDDQPYGMVEEISRAILYPSHHPYSWTVIGKMEDLEAATLEDVQEFFRMYYAPNNASLCIAGDFQPEQVKQWVEKYFAPIPPGPPVNRIEAWIPTLNEEIRTVLTDEVELPRLYMTWHTPAYYSPGDAEFDLLASILAAGKTSRLYKALVYDRQMAQDVTAFQSSLELGSLFYIIVTAKEGHSLQEIEREVDRILSDLLMNGVTTDEFERAQINRESAFVRRLEDLGGFGGRADLLNRYNTYLGDPGHLPWDRNRYTDATIDGMLAYARDYLRPDARLVLYVEPYGQLAETDKGTEMSLEPEPETDPSFTTPQIQQATLTNGLKLYLVENHKLPLIQVNLLIKSGWAADPADRPGTASLTAELLNEGTKSRSTLEISDEARRLGLYFGVASTFDYTSVNLNVLKKNLDPALDLMGDVVLNPTFPEEELQRQKQIYLGRIRQESSQAFTVAYKSFQREIYGENHPYGQPYTGSGTEKSINAISRSDIESFYRVNFLPNNAAAIVVGDITLEQARTGLERVFKKWKRGDLAPGSVPAVAPPDRTRICIVDFPGTSQSTIFLGNLLGSRKDPDYLPATVVNQVLGADPSARLFKNLREDKGYTYGAYSFITARRGQGLLCCYAQVQTDVTGKAIVEFVRELRGIVGERPMSGADLTDSRNKLTKGFPQDFQSLPGVAYELSTMITHDLPMDTWNTYVTRINDVGVDEALATANRWVKPDEILIVVVGDRSAIEDEIRGLNLGEVYFSELH